MVVRSQSSVGFRVGGSGSHGPSSFNESSAIRLTLACGPSCDCSHRIRLTICRRCERWAGRHQRLHRERVPTTVTGRALAGRNRRVGHHDRRATSRCSRGARRRPRDQRRTPCYERGSFGRSRSTKQSPTRRRSSGSCCATAGRACPSTTRGSPRLRSLMMFLLLRKTSTTWTCPDSLSSASEV